MKEKIQRGIKKYKNKFIVIAILWVVISIVFIAPLSISIVDALSPGKFDFAIFSETLGKQIINPFGALGTALGTTYIGMFWGILWKFTLMYIILMCIGIARSLPKHEYDDIEHGSSDWSENGEEYKTLSKNKGIILAEKEYLPVDKRGNVNVLVVGRFRFW